MELGAKKFHDMGPYFSPGSDLLPVIYHLEVTNGFKCNYCPLDGQDKAYYCGKESTMKRHIQVSHRDRPHSAFVGYHVQSIYNHMKLKFYFGVKKVFLGPSVTSTITDQGEVLMKRYCSKNSENELFNVVTAARIIPRFYKESNWLGLVVTIAGEDTVLRRIELHHWVNYKNDNGNILHGNLDRWVVKYFGRIQDILLDSTRNDYHWRRQVMHLSR